MFTKRVLIVGSVLSMLLLIAIICLADQDRSLISFIRGERFFQGHPTSYWRPKFAGDGAAKNLSPALLKSFHLQVRAVPVLEQLVQDPDPNIRWSAIALIDRCADFSKCFDIFTDHLRDPDKQVAIQAILGLGRMRRESLDALPQLATLTEAKDLDIAVAASLALWNIDPPSAIEVEDWKQFESNDWGFALPLPGQVEEQLRPSPVGAPDFPVFTAKVGTTVFNVMVVTSPITDEDQLRSQIEAAAQAKANSLSGILAKDIAAECSGIPGREHRIDIAKEGQQFRVHDRQFVVCDRVYSITATYNPDHIHPAAIQHCFDSFQILPSARKPFAVSPSATIGDSSPGDGSAE